MQRPKDCAERDRRGYARDKSFHSEGAGTGTRTPRLNLVTGREGERDLPVCGWLSVNTLAAPSRKKGR